MKALITLFWQMCLFRLGPDKVPYSRELTLVLITAFWLTGLAHLLVYMPLAEAVLYNSLVLAIYLAFIYICLQFMGYISRYQQTISALLGTQTLITLFFLFPMIAVGEYFINTSVVTAATLFLSFIIIIGMLMIAIWWIMVASFIMGRSLNDNILLGLLVIIIYKVLEFVILSTIW